MSLVKTKSHGPFFARIGVRIRFVCSLGHKTRMQLTSCRGMCLMNPSNTKSNNCRSHESWDAKVVNQPKKRRHTQIYQMSFRLLKNLQPTHLLFWPRDLSSLWAPEWTEPKARCSHIGQWPKKRSWRKARESPVDDERRRLRPRLGGGYQLGALLHWKNQTHKHSIAMSICLWTRGSSLYAILSFWDEKSTQSI